VMSCEYPNRRFRAFERSQRLSVRAESDDLHIKARARVGDFKGRAGKQCTSLFEQSHPCQMRPMRPGLEHDTNRETCDLSWFSDLFYALPDTNWVSRGTFVSTNNDLDMSG
jgi:hypothetical protein